MAVAEKTKAVLEWKVVLERPRQLQNAEAVAEVGRAVVLLGESCVW